MEDWIYIKYNDKTRYFPKYEIIRQNVPKNHRWGVGLAEVKSRQMPPVGAVFDMNDQRSHSKLFLEIWIGLVFGGK